MAASANTYCHSVLGGYEGGWKEQPTWSEDNAWTLSDKLSEELLTPRPQAELLVCKTDNLKYIERLLILGTGQQNKYKSGISKISAEDLALIQSEIDSPTNCYKLLDLVADIYLKGRAPKQDMTMHVLALICRSKTNVTLRRRGYELVGQLRTLSQLYLFLGFYTGGTPSATHAADPRTKEKKQSVTALAEGSAGLKGRNRPLGFGRAFKTALNRSFLKKTPQALAYQVTKYQSRGDWSFNDIIKCTHLRTGTGENRKRNTKYLPSDYQAPPIKPATPMDLVLRYSMYGMEELTKLAQAFNLLEDPIYSYLCGVDIAKKMQENTESNVNDLIQLIFKHRLVREHLPTWSMKNCAVQRALLFGDYRRGGAKPPPMTALLRNLASLTSIGLFEDKELLSLVVKHLTDKEAVQKSRIHPVNVIIAWFVYRKGHGFKGKLTWTPLKEICDALEQMAFLAFANAPPTTKRYGVFIDGSGSMTAETTFQGLSNADIAALLSLVIARSSQRPQAQLQEHLFYVFSAKNTGSYKKYGTPTDNTGLYDVGHHIHANSTFQEVLDAVQLSNWGSTDISNGIRYLERANKHVDAVIVITDNDINTGEKPLVALNSYRAKIGNPNVKLITLAVQLNDLTIADPSDKGMLDMCGFDTNSYQVMHAFTHETPFGGGGDEAEAD
uniref:TROVE domain-containing protein n=1 Tax=viral metagenome TaxID=1070528 RepID=A0A6C0HHQ0_9ZZZZ